MLSGVSDVFNAIMVRGDEVGDVMFYGRGAGKLPTASAVVGDVIDCVKHLETRKYLFWEDGDKSYVADYMNDITKLFVRCTTDDCDGLIKEIETIFSNVSYIKNANKNEVVFLTENDIENTLRNQIATLTKATSVKVLHAID